MSYFEFEFAYFFLLGGGVGDNFNAYSAITASSAIFC